jgi:tripartite-type tricarboxylate transporter receptor subunit TctC
MTFIPNGSERSDSASTDALLERRTFVGAACAAAVATVLPGTLHAQSVYPSKAVTLIVPNPPGGNTDILARIFSVPLAKALGQPVVVDNRSGAGGVIGMTAAARAPADGYTIGLGNLSDLVVSRYAQANVPYDPAKDFVAVATLAKVSIVVTALPTFPAKSFQEFLALAKANPGKYKCGTAGNGSMGHLCLEALQSAAGVEIVHVPYRGGAPALNDLLGGHIDLLIDGSALSQVKAAKLKALAVTAERLSVLPNVPTVEESGVPGFSFGNYWGLLMPTGSPAAAVTRLNAEIKRLLGQPDVRQQLENSGFAPLASSPSDYSQALQKSYEQIGQLVKKAKITFD